MNERSYKHLFGPVPSRRLGRSLGVDLIPFKTCTYDCIYCQIGRTTNKTLEREQYVSPGPVLDEIRHILDHNPGIDCFTIAGSGEPTLNSEVGRVIRGIKDLTDIPVMVLTNGSLLNLPEVRDALLPADVVMPTLVSTQEVVYENIHRPHPDLKLANTLQGLEQFRKEYSGELRIELFLLAGMNALEAEVKSMAKLLAEIKPDQVQLNTAVRLAAEDFSYTVSRERLEDLAKLFTPPAEIIAKTPPVEQDRQWQAGADDVLNILKRRPMTAGDLAEVMGQHINQVDKLINYLLDKGLIQAEKWEGKTFFSARQG